MMRYSTGSLVRVRGRDWVVQPSQDNGWYILQPLGGGVAEEIAVSPDMEKIEPATFALPDPDRFGDATSGAFLRDAVRLGFRSTTGPFRSFGRIAVEPRPYQLVPLLMAMKQSMVRILIADDVGIGKTIEAGLIVRELMDRGEVSRIAVLCPPQLAEQWQEELSSKFHIEAELVLPSTVRRLENGLGVGTSLFEVYPFTIVSLDFIKSDRHREEFLRACPECVIIDEAHSCASPEGNRSAKQRFSLVQQLAASNRHMIFVTATPHSGKSDVFHSLLSFLKPEFATLPQDLAGKENEASRKELARYFIQRRRADIRSYLNARTAFPERVTGEMTWRFSQAEERFFQKVLDLARESLKLGEGEKIFIRHIFWWSAIALLRAVSSSPSAAKATLKNRAMGTGFESENVEQLDNDARQTILDLTYTDDAAVTDTLAGSDSSQSQIEMSEDLRSVLRRRFQSLAREAEELEGYEHDSKLKKATTIVKTLLGDGYSPIVFCRFIHTAEYVKSALEEKIPSAAIAVVTGTLPPEERENRVEQLKKEKKRVLVATDCLSEGINLQDCFNAVLHYDLSWNPTRHEQREGRVDRYGQPFDKVKVITLFGENNPVDGYVLDVLLRKHETIRKALGISVPFPEDSDKVMQAILQGVFLCKNEKTGKERAQMLLPSLEEFFNPQKKEIEAEWDRLAAREEKRSRTIFAQQAIKVENVAQEIADTEETGGSAKTVEHFLSEAVRRLGGVDNVITEKGIERKAHTFSFDENVRQKHKSLDLPESMTVVYEEPVLPGQEMLTRTHPFVENTANYVFETAMDTIDQSMASRCGVMRTKRVQKRTVLLLCRFRYELITKGTITHTDLTEECALLAYKGASDKAEWLDESEARTLLYAEAEGNVNTTTCIQFISKVNEGADKLLPHIREIMKMRAARFLERHRRVRDAANLRGVRFEVHPQGEPDLIGVFVFLPVM